MRENRTYGSEGGEGLHPFPDPYRNCLSAGFPDSIESRRPQQKWVPAFLTEQSPWLKASKIPTAVALAAILAAGRLGECTDKPEQCTDKPERGKARRGK